MSESPRAKFLKRFQDKELAAVVYDTLQLASHHDPDHAKDIKYAKSDIHILFEKVEELESEIQLAQRRLDRIGAPQYRPIKKNGKIIG